MTYAITIIGWQPARLNQLLGGWRKAHRLKTHDRAVINGYCCIDARIPPATGKRRVTLTIVLGKGQRAGDPDAYWKSLLDALSACGALRDDNRQGVELAPVQFERAAVMATRIELEDL